MNKHRRHYPSYVTNSIIRDYMAEQSNPRKARLTPFSYILITFAAVLMMTGLFGITSMLRPQSAAAAQVGAPVSSVR